MILECTHAVWDFSGLQPHVVSKCHSFGFPGRCFMINSLKWLYEFCRKVGKLDMELPKTG